MNEEDGRNSGCLKILAKSAKIIFGYLNHKQTLPERPKENSVCIDTNRHSLRLLGLGYIKLLLAFIKKTFKKGQLGVRLATLAS